MSVAREALHSLSPSDSRLCPNQQPNHLKKSALSMTETWVSGEGIPHAEYINYSHSCLWNVKAATSGHHHHCYIVAKLVDANIYLSRYNESSWLSLLLHTKNDIFINMCLPWEYLLSGCDNMTMRAYIDEGLGICYELDPNPDRDPPLKNG